MHAVEVGAAITILETGVLPVHRRNPEQGSLLKAGPAQYALPAFSGRVRAGRTRPSSCVLPCWGCPGE